MNRRTVIYTSGVLETLYSLKSSDIKSDVYGHEYVSSTALLHGVPYVVGLCDKDYKYHILTSREKMMMDMLLSWDSLVSEETEDGPVIIKFTDIDWMKNRYKKNKEHIKVAHNLYKTIIETLSGLYFICDSEEPRTLNDDCLYHLFNYTPIIENEEMVGITYYFDELGKLLKSYNMKTTLNGNAFKFRFNEDMKYWILRYLVVSVFMNRIKSKTVTRTHRSIVKALVVDTGVETISYYDALMDKRHPHKYLSRYIQRLKEVLEMLKDMEFIKDYSIETITNIQELQTGCGLVRITPNMSNRIHRTRTYLSK